MSESDAVTTSKTDVGTTLIFDRATTYDNVVATSLCKLGSNEYNIRNFQVLSDFRRTVNYGIETIHTESHLFWKNYHLIINLKLPLKNLK